MNVYEFFDYKSYLRELIRESPRGAVSELARAAGCDRTYFSQMLNGKVHLTPDHIINLGETLVLSESEKSYLLLMLLRDRAASREARLVMEARMERLQKEQMHLAKQIQAKEATSELADSQKAKYYSTWLFGAIHILTSIREYRTVAAIAERLRIPERVAKEHLEALAAMGLVEKNRDSYSHSGANVHIASDSPLSSIHHVNWRTRAAAKLSMLGTGDDLHYTSSFSISKSDWQKLKKQVLKFIDSHRSSVHESGSEEAYCISVDLFRLE